MKKVFLGIGLVTMLISGCGGPLKAGKVREDITDITMRSEYKGHAQQFLSDAAMQELLNAPDSDKTHDYCKSYTGKGTYEVKDKIARVGATLETFGLSGMHKLTDPKKGALGRGEEKDWDALERYCNNFFTFTSRLTVDERRKLLIFVGSDYFSANWLDEKYQAHQFPSDLAVEPAQMSMVLDSGFREQRANEDLDSYIKNKIAWQKRNAGIAMVGWLDYMGIGSKFGVLNPETWDRLKLNYQTPRIKGFADVRFQMPTAPDDIMVNGKFIKRKHTKEIVNVWGGTESISLRRKATPEATYQRYREKFLPSDKMNLLFEGLSTKYPEFESIKHSTVYSISDAQLQEVKDYAKYLIDRENSK